MTAGWVPSPGLPGRHSRACSCTHSQPLGKVPSGLLPGSLGWSVCTSLTLLGENSQSQAIPQNTCAIKGVFVVMCRKLAA
jgi:hypothetical protein